MLLAAHAPGLGAVWAGVYPREPGVEGLRRLLHVPERVIPHSLVVLGYPKTATARTGSAATGGAKRTEWVAPRAGRL